MDANTKLGVFRNCQKEKHFGVLFSSRRHENFTGCREIPLTGPNVVFIAGLLTSPSSVHDDEGINIHIRSAKVIILLQIDFRLFHQTHRIISHGLNLGFVILWIIFAIETSPIMRSGMGQREWTNDITGYGNLVAADFAGIIRDAHWNLVSGNEPAKGLGSVFMSGVVLKFTRTTMTLRSTQFSETVRVRVCQPVLDGVSEAWLMQCRSSDTCEGEVPGGIFQA